MIIDHIYCLQEAIIDLSNIQSIEIAQKGSNDIVIFFVSGTDRIISGEEAGRLLLEIERCYFGKKLSKPFQEIISATVPPAEIIAEDEDEEFF